MSNIPKLRFPEFTDAWEKWELGDVIIDEIKGKAKADMLGEQSLYLDANYLNGGNELYVNSPTDVDKNDVIILWDGSQAGTVYHGFSGALGSTFKAFRPKQSGAFLYQQLKRYQDTIYNSYRTPNIPHVIKSFTKEFNISIPNYEEQQKIGALFRRLDRLITLHKRKWDDVILLKKALLQKMFPKNGSDFPEIRFPEFTDAWEKCKLGEIATINPKSTLPQTFNYVDLESVVGTEMRSYKIEKLYSAPSRAQRLAKYGDIFYQTVRPYQKNNYLFELDDENYVFSTGYAQIRSKIYPYFLFTLIQNDRFVNEVLDNCTGTSYPAINATDLKNITIFISNNPTEQQKIGNLFKQLDRLITLHKRQHEHYQLLKKALLQQMFV